MNPIRTLTHFIHRTLTDPVGEGTWLQLRLRWAVDLTRHCAREMFHDRAAEAAAALTYRTVFSLIPVLVLAVVIFNAFGGFQKTGHRIQDDIATFMGLNLTIPPPRAHTRGAPAPGPATAPAAAPAPGRSMDDRGSDDASADISATAPIPEGDLQAQFGNILNYLTRRASTQHFGAVGAVGVLLLVWAGLALLVTVERVFNRIFDCPTGRPWVARVVVYWTVLTLGPLLLLASLYLTGVVSAQGHKIALVGWLLVQLSWCTALLATWLLLFLLYLLMPNTRVRVRPALIGSFVTAALYELTKSGFQLYVSKAVPYAKLYGSLGLIPLFLFWVYVTWLIVIFGLELTYTLQAMRGRAFKHLQSHPEGGLTGDPRWIIPLMAAIAKSFAQGKAIALGELASATGVPLLAATELTRRLEAEGLVYRVQHAGTHDVGLALARPAEQVTLAHLVGVARGISQGALAARDLRKDPGWGCLHKLAEVQKNAVGDTTLATLIAPQEA